MPYTHRQLWLHKHYLKRVLYHCRMVTVGRRGRDGFCVHETSRSGLLSRSNVFHTRGEGQSFDYALWIYFQCSRKETHSSVHLVFFLFLILGDRICFLLFPVGQKAQNPLQYITEVRCTKSCKLLFKQNSCMIYLLCIQVDPYMQHTYTKTHRHTHKQKHKADTSSRLTLLAVPKSAKI